MKTILFVCLGNICRSPAAEAIVRDQNPHLVTDSAGTGDYHVGEPPYGPMQRAAGLRGLDMSDLRARQFSVSDFAVFDLILAMDRSNLDDIEAVRPEGNATPVRLFAEFAPERGQDSVPHPYYTRDFDGCLDLLQEAARGLRDTLEQERPNAE